MGGGPVGLALALGLSPHGVRWKAPAIHVRTREVLRLWGVGEQFLEVGLFLEPVTMDSVRRGRGQGDFSSSHGTPWCHPL